MTMDPPSTTSSKNISMDTMDATESSIPLISKLDLFFSELPGTYLIERIRAMIHMGTLTRKMYCHPNEPVSHPPRIGAMIIEAPAPVSIAPVTRPCMSSGNIVTIMMGSVAAHRTAPIPSTTLNAMSTQ